MADGDVQLRGWIQIAVQTVGVIVVAILFVSRIEKQADLLAVNLQHLTSAVVNLDTQVDRLRDATQMLDRRLVKIESAAEIAEREERRRVLEERRRAE